MEFTGDLSQVSVPQVLAAINNDMQTGILYLDAQTAAGGEKLELWLDQGYVLQVDSPTRQNAWKLGEILVQGGLITSEERERALAEHNKTSKPLGAVLLELNLLRESLLSEVLLMQAQEDLHRSLVWRNGTYEFSVRPLRPRPGPQYSLVLADEVEVGIWQLQEWPRLRALVPTPDICFSQTHQGALPPELAEQYQLGEQEQRVFELIHPRRSVQLLGFLTRLESFEIYRSLALLMHAGVIAQQKKTTRTNRTHGAGVQRGLVFHGFTAVLILLLLALGISSFLRVYETRSTQPTDQFAAQIDPWREALTQAQLQRISTALEVYRIQQGDYPPRLQVLLEEELLSPQDLVYPDYENSYTYRPEGESYILVQPKR